MININILFPSEKRRIIEEISKKIKSELNEDVKRFISSNHLPYFQNKTSAD